MGGKKIQIMKKNIKKKLIFVGLSGGVDSSVSAGILKEQGHEVVGVFIKTWHPDFLSCTWREERRDAMRVAATLDIPFLTFDLEKTYKKEVADYMIREYKAGRTPNPDVMCNKSVKFGAFFDKAIKMGADAVATGHYAQILPLHLTKGEAGRGSGPTSILPLSRGGRNSLSLAKGVDPSKDQSYFLWTLNKKQLSKIIFPVGQMQKSEVRKLAKKFNLPTAEKKDSQGVCFLGALDMKDFLKHYIKEKAGKVLNEQGKIIGKHEGAVFYTLGERHGFEILKKGTNESRYYIIDKDIKKNTITVSNSPLLVEEGVGGGDLNQNPPKPSLIKEGIELKDTNFTTKIDEKKKYECQVRYHGEFLPCKIICAKSNFAHGKAKVIFEKPIRASAGQSIVIYDGDICLGGGVIK